MKRLASVLVAVDAVGPGITALHKAVAIAARFDADIDLLIADVSNVAAMVAHSAELGYARITVCSLHRDGESLHDLILRKVAVMRPDLVIKAPQGGQPGMPGQEDWLLASQCHTPILLAGSRVWDPLPRFAAAIEVSDSAGCSCARAIFPKAVLLARSCEASLDLLCSERNESDETSRMEHAVQIARLLREYHLGTERLHMTAGPAELRLPALIAARHYDLLVLSVPGQGPWIAMTDNSPPSKLAAATQGDLLLVSAELPPRTAYWSAGLSGRQEILHEREQLG